MSKHTKLLNLVIDYELKEEEEKDLKTTALITRNLINSAFTQNYAKGMNSKVSKQWRSIRRVLDEAIEDSKVDHVIFALSDFDSTYEEVYACEYNPAFSRMAPYLYDALDIAKNRSDEDEEKVQEAVEVLKNESKKLDTAAPTELKPKDDIVKQKLAEVVQEEKAAR